MIQRIQTIWLSLCIALSIFLLNGRLAEFIGQNNEKLSLGQKGLSLDSAEGLRIINHKFPLLITILIIPAFSLVAILLYRKRSLQKISVFIVIAASVLTYLETALYWNYAFRTYKAHFLPCLKLILPAIIIIIAMLALLGIKKDEAVVKSYERLR